MAVAIFPHPIMASVAIKNASIIVPESPMINRLSISHLVRKKVAGIRMASKVRIKRLFSSLAMLLSMI